MDSGFNKVRPKEYRPRLLHLKGRRHVRLTEVPLAAASVNSGDVFVLDLGLRLVQFNGKDSSGRERIKAAELCRAIDDERENLPEVVVFEEYSRPEDWPAEWVNLLRCGPYTMAAKGSDDLAFEHQGMQYTIDYLQKHNRPLTTPITVTMQGAESSYFWSQFSK